MAYTFKMANAFAHKHGISYMIEPYEHFLIDDICFQVTVCDAFDGYLSSESYFIMKAYPHGVCYRPRNFRYSFKKDDMLLHRLCCAIEDDYNNMLCGGWI